MSHQPKKIQQVSIQKGKIMDLFEEMNPAD